jgi:hypothetical protein
MSTLDNASLRIQVSREFNAKESLRINSLIAKAKRRTSIQSPSDELQIILDFSQNQTMDALGVAFVINLLRHADSQTTYEFVGISAWLRQELKVLKLTPQRQGFSLPRMPSFQGV